MSFKVSTAKVDMACPASTRTWAGTGHKADRAQSGAMIRTRSRCTLAAP